MKMSDNAIVLTGSGSIVQEIVRQRGAGKHILRADLNQENNDANANSPGDTEINVSTTIDDVSLRTSVHTITIDQD